ncbi:MAG TPA: molybdenum cofactor biosynthesis protein MoaE [Candidatus Bathyarchaeia archaeon]|nr:molybdenum cofactor biosynthesis protein MoaE [Candidatus Bathyarchaeia archaeon]
MRVRVLYLGMLKDLAGRDKEQLQLPENSRLGDLFEQLQRTIPKLTDLRGAIALAVNCNYSDPSTVLRDNDEVALLPPVSGGKTREQKANDESSTAETPLPLISEHARLVREPIKMVAVLAALKRPEDGALASFDGIVRNNSRGRRTLYLDYTAYERMALHQMERLAQEALGRFAVRDARLVHRLGRLQIGDTSVYIAVAAAHRAAAFDACRWLIDSLKTTVPIWKKEYFEDGAVWADGEPFPPEVPRAGQTASK